MGTDPPQALDVLQNGPEDTHLEDYMLVPKSALRTSTQSGIVLPLKSPQIGQPILYSTLHDFQRGEVVNSIEECKTLIQSNPSSVPPTKEMLRNLVAVPSGMFSSSRSGGRKQKGRKGVKTLTSKAFNPVAGRPSIKSTLRTPQIQVEMMVQGSAFQTSVTVPVYWSNYFAISGYSDSAAYLALFDQYRIDMIEFWLEPNGSQSVSDIGIGSISTCVDVDDANTPTSVSSVQAHQNCLVTSGYTGHYHKWKPHMAVSAYSGAFTSFSNVPAGWIDSASPGVQHYGIKASAITTTAVIGYSYTARMQVSFRSPGI